MNRLIPSPTLGKKVIDTQKIANIPRSTDPMESPVLRQVGKHLSMPFFIPISVARGMYDQYKNLPEVAERTAAFVRGTGQYDPRVNEFAMEALGAGYPGGIADSSALGMTKKTRLELFGGQSGAKKILPKNIMTETEFNDAIKLWHGTKKPFYGKPKIGRADLGLKNFGMEKDVFEGFYTSRDKKGALLYAQLDEKNIIPVRLAKDSKILDLSDSIISQEVLGSTGSLARSPLSSLKPPKKQFPFQTEFEDYSFKKLNEARIKNNALPLTKNSIEWNKKVGGEFDPISVEWNMNGIASKYLENFIKSKGYDAIQFGRETVILNPEKVFAGTYKQYKEVMTKK